MAVRDQLRRSPQTSWLDDKRTGQILTFVALPLLLIAALLLPPFSLVQRIGDLGTTRVTEAGGVISDPDGTQVIFQPGSVVEPFRASLTSVPRVTFLEGSAGKDLLDAAKAIPESLVAKSPFYQLSLRGTAPSEATWVSRIPNDSEPYETLDVYTWESELQRWQWLPHNIVVSEDGSQDDLIESASPAIPQAFMVMQTNPQPALASLDLAQAAELSAEGRNVLSEVHPTGLSLGADGAVTGSLDATFDQLGSSFAVIPVIRNHDGPIVRTDLFNNMLVDENQRTAHVDTLVNLAVGALYKGVDIDYRGLDRNLRGEYLQFLKELADRLHQEGKVLHVRVEPGSQVADDRFDTGAYDWRPIGLIADAVKIPAPIDPRAYVPGGQFDALLRYAVGQIDRFKVRMVFGGQSIELAGAYLLPKTYNDALQPLIGRIAADTSVVEPGKPLNLALVSTRPTSGLVYDPNLGTYVYRYQDEQGNARTVWLENAASMNHKLETLKKYNVQGFTMEKLPADGLDVDLWPLMRNFQQGQLQDIKSNFLVEWTIRDANGQTVSEVRPLGDANFAIAAPNQPGALQIEAAIKDRGQVLAMANTGDAIAVATYTPTPTPTPVFTPTPTPSPTPEFAMARANNNANARSGPSTAYPRVGQLASGQSYQIAGQNDSGTWWQLLVDGKGVWVSGDLVTVSGNAEGVAIVEVAPPPTAVPVAAAPKTAAPAGNLPASGTGYFGYGIQIDPYGDRPQAIGMIQSMGFGWVKFQLPWKDFEGSPGAKNFPDDVIGQLSGAGLKILVSIVKAPNWARPGNTDFSVEGPPADPGTYADYVGAFAARYKGKVQAIEVWNEQNLWYEWGHEPLDPGRYVTLLCRAYNAIKAQDPGMVVVSGALTPTGLNDGSTAIDDFVYLQRMYAAGAKGCFNAVGAHPSGYNNPPDAKFGYSNPAEPSFKNHPSFFFRDTMERYRAVMVANGDSAKRIWPTEFGWASTGSPHPGYEYAAQNTADEQAQFIVRAYQMMKSWGWVGPAFLWNLNYNLTAPDKELAAFGIAGRPAYSALQSMPK
jgi:hypothetical protein